MEWGSRAACMGRVVVDVGAVREGGSLDKEAFSVVLRILT